MPSTSMCMLYSYINLLKNVTFTLGASGDFFDTTSGSGLGDRSQFNPKFGITWKSVPSTTVRAAVFRALKRTLITDQTLEPTQVAGFNQFFDDLEWHGVMALWGGDRSEILTERYSEAWNFPRGI